MYSLFVYLFIYTCVCFCWRCCLRANPIIVEYVYTVTSVLCCKRSVCFYITSLVCAFATVVSHTVEFVSNARLAKSSLCSCRISHPPGRLRQHHRCGGEAPIASFPDPFRRDGGHRRLSGTPACATAAIPAGRPARFAAVVLLICRWHTGAHAAGGLQHGSLSACVVGCCSRVVRLWNVSIYYVDCMRQSFGGRCRPAAS